MTRNISHTPRKPSVREAENMIRVCFVCHGNICRIVYKRKVDMRLNLI